MALIDMDFMNGGGTASETTLWTNSSPSSSFADQTVTLSDNINNYTHLKIKFNRSTTDTTTKTEVIYTVKEFKKYVVGANSFNGAVAFYASTSTGSAYARRILYMSDTSIRFSTMYQVGGSYSDNGACIPTEIVGINTLVSKGTGSVSYALSYSHYLSGSYGANLGYVYDSEGNSILNTASTINNNYVSVALSGGASSTTITVTCVKAGYYNVLGRTLDGSTVTNISTREYKNVGDTVYTRTSSNSTRTTYIIIWLEA